MAALVHVTDMVNASSFPINGEKLTAREALSQFLRVDPSDVESSLGERTASIVNRGTITDFDMEMRANETITLYPKQVQQGGVKAAFQS